ncbi:MAG: pyridoxal-phosphate dependent enzyme [Planctomycetes bacterium]|nr:pyridoxal-phosphate dependent enzyme [Planctomycetota bacterium]
MGGSTPPPVNDILHCVGNTPMVRLHRLTEEIRTPVFAKCEFMNPGGSVKDRIGIAIIEEAERGGQLQPGGLVVEGTSGNTGVGLALAAAIRGYRCIFTIPDKMSTEKVKLLKAFGAEVIVTPTVSPEHPDYYVTIAKRIAEESSNAILANQFYNQANPDAHYRTTGPEIWEQTEGRITALVGGMGTGGTMTGAARFLKEKNPVIRVVAGDPDGSVLKNAKATGEVSGGQPYKVEGIGNDKIPGTCDLDLIDEIRTVSDQDAFLMARRLTREEGLFGGGSSGLAAVVALDVAREIDDPSALVVLILPSTGERYLSKLFSDEWMQENRFLPSDDVKATDLMTKKREGITSLLSISEDKPVKHALATMNEYGVTQLPVMSGGECIGSVRESSLMALAIEDRDALESAVSNIMGAPFPVVQANDPVDHVMQLFTRDNEAVLVRTAGEIQGILTRSDLIQHLSGK